MKSFSKSENLTNRSNFERNLNSKFAKFFQKRALNFIRRGADFLGLKGGLVPRRSYNLIFITHFISIKIIIILLSEIYLYFSKKKSSRNAANKAAFYNKPLFRPADQRTYG
jgi:hypothetical protein